MGNKKSSLSQQSTVAHDDASLIYANNSAAAFGRTDGYANVARRGRSACTLGDECDTAGGEGEPAAGAGAGAAAAMSVSAHLCPNGSSLPAAGSAPAMTSVGDGGGGSTSPSGVTLVVRPRASSNVSAGQPLECHSRDGDDESHGDDGGDEDDAAERELMRRQRRQRRRNVQLLSPAELDHAADSSTSSRHGAVSHRRSSTPTALRARATRRATQLLVSMAGQRDAHVFTVEKKDMVADSWRAIKAEHRGDLAKLGAKIFQRVLAQCPELRATFNVPLRLSLEHLPDYEPFSRFARVFAMLFDLCARNIHQLDAEIGPICTMYGRRHRHMTDRGFQLQYLRAFSACINEFLFDQVVSLESIECPVDECMNGWGHVLEFVVRRMADGYDMERGSRGVFTKQHSTATAAGAGGDEEHSGAESTPPTSRTRRRISALFAQAKGK